ncbi:hypothetical protein KCP71_15495 [Salmonella enterica subsp. enterica]|nr:hypothetical protein KCP71_15495 [Salmonella enterica subsp. enterica]
MALWADAKVQPPSRQRWFVGSSNESRKTSSKILLIAGDKLVQGNLVDIQTHDKLSFKTGRFSHRLPEDASNRPVISGVIRNAVILGIKCRKKTVALVISAFS